MNRQYHNPPVEVAHQSTRLGEPPMKRKKDRIINIDAWKLQNYLCKNAEVICTFQ